MTINDPFYETTHVLENSRFNFQSRDSYADLLARDAWTSVWYDRYEGTLNLDYPTLSRVTHSFRVRVIASWDEPFVVLEFKIKDDFCQVSTRPRAHARGWRKGPYLSEIHLVPARPESTSTRIENAGPTDTTNPSSSSNQLPPDEPTDEPTNVSFLEAQNESSDDHISEARLTDAESEVIEYESDSVSEARPRNLSSVATLTTYAAGDEDPDYPIEFFHPPEIVQIDFDRVELISTVSRLELGKEKVVGSH